MRVFRLLAIIIIVVFSMPTTAAAHLSQNIRQGPQPVFAISCPGEAHVKSDGQQRQALFSSDFVSEPLFMLDDALGSTIALTNHSGNVLARMNYDAWGNLWWPRKQAYHAPPCHKNNLGSFIDRFRGHILGKAQHDPWRLGYHFAKVLTPYLYTGRKFDTTTQTYFNRWRQYNPKAGRFLSSDPIGFNGGNNLYGYANLNPLTHTDPHGLQPDFPFWKFNTYEKFTEDYALDPSELTTQLFYEQVFLNQHQDPGEIMGRMVEILAYFESAGAIERFGEKLLNRVPQNLRCVTEQAVEKAKKIKVSELEFDLQMFAKNKPKVKIDPTKPIRQQLTGKGQLKALERSPHFKGVRLSDLLDLTPAELDDWAKRGLVSKRTRRQILKAFEGRNLFK